MRGIILAGGTGSRLMPLTKTINKHCLPVGSVPMIYHPLRVLLENGIEDITIVSSPSGVGQLAAMLGSGYQRGCRLTYRVQDEAGSLMNALMAARGYGTAAPCYERTAVILGDNVFLPSPKLCETSGAVCFVKHIGDVEQLKAFGVPTLGGDGAIMELIEKPIAPASDYAVTGLYVFPEDIWGMGLACRDMIDVLNVYAKNHALSHVVVDGFWGDAGTFDGMAECAAAMKEHSCASS